MGAYNAQKAATQKERRPAERRRDQDGKLNVLGETLLDPILSEWPSADGFILRHRVFIHTVQGKIHCMLTTYSYNARPEYYLQCAYIVRDAAHARSDA